jgi:hypothetical protein
VLAQGPFMYTLNSSGNVSVNGNKIITLKTSYNPNNPLLYPDQAWRDLLVLDGNQLALRGDGLVVSNGAKLFQWPIPINLYFWTQLKFSNGSFYGLRQDGKLAVNKDTVATLPVDNYYFTSLQVANGATYALRSDGNVYKNSGTTPFFQFRAGNGLGGGSDGDEPDTVWYSIRVDPTGLFLYALRTDGQLYRGQLLSSASGVTLDNSFPFPNSNYNYADLYLDFEFGNAAGDWIVLRSNGMTYRAPNALSEFINYPGGGNGVYYVDLSVLSNEFFALRSDGKTYSQNSTNVIVKLTGSDYGRIVMSTAAPNLAGSKNIAPYVAVYTIPINTDSPVKVPVIATDVETPTDELVVTPVSWPTGAVWDANAWDFAWTTPTNKGNYTFSYAVDDGKGSAKTYKSTVQVKLPDTDPAKNKPPYLPKINNAGALVGEEYRVYIPLNDPDGDTVTATVDTNTYPFNVGAAYNPVTSEFTWTPRSYDLGKKTVAFTLSDGVTMKKLNLKIQVNSPLFIPPLPGS